MAHRRFMKIGGQHLGAILMVERCEPLNANAECERVPRLF